jgi:hypothetical protein
VPARPAEQFPANPSPRLLQTGRARTAERRRAQGVTRLLAPSCSEWLPQARRTAPGLCRGLPQPSAERTEPRDSDDSFAAVGI